MEHKKKMFQEFIRVQIHDYRSGRAYTQEQMAELLHVAPRSYFDQEHGKYGFSAVTVIYVDGQSIPDTIRSYAELQRLPLCGIWNSSGCRESQPPAGSDKRALSGNRKTLPC